MVKLGMKIHLRHVLLYLFDKDNGISGTDAAKIIQTTYGSGSISERVCQKWLARFRNGDKSVEDLEDNERQGRPVTFDEDLLRYAVTQNPDVTLRELQSQFNCSLSTLDSHLHAIGMVHKYGQWVPHALTQEQKEIRLRVASHLLARLEAGTLKLDDIVTGDEKWVLYVNVSRRGHWVEHGTNPPPTPRPPLHPKKVLLSLFWDTEGVIYWELLHETVKAATYCRQLDTLSAAMKEKRPQRTHVLLLHDNARPHVANVTKTKIESLGWEVLPNAPYSPDLAPTDFKVFRSLQKRLENKEFETEDEVEAFINEWIGSQNSGFWVKGITDLPNRWNKTIDYAGNYFPEH